MRRNEWMTVRNKTHSFMLVLKSWSMDSRPLGIWMKLLQVVSGHNKSEGELDDITQIGQVAGRSQSSCCP